MTQSADERKKIAGIINNYKAEKENIPTNASIPSQYENVNKETDPDLLMSYEVVKLPSRGIFYKSGIDEVNVEYMTSKDEDLLTTPSLIENGSVIDILLKRKVKTNGIQIETLLGGDRNAIILFLRTSSYGSNYTVIVNDPRTDIPFKETINLLNLKYKEVSEIPDELGQFTVEIPMRKKTVKIKLLTSGEENYLRKQAEKIKEAYGEDHSTFNTLRLKSSIVSINGNIDRNYIDKFVDVMPALDAVTIRRKILDVSPDVDMAYQFTAPDGYPFYANLEVGPDFFFPQV